MIDTLAFALIDSKPRANPCALGNLGRCRCPLPA
jgi:hypothetical protein